MCGLVEIFSEQDSLVTAHRQITLMICSLKRWLSRSPYFFTNFWKHWSYNFLKHWRSLDWSNQHSSATTRPHLTVYSHYKKVRAFSLPITYALVCEEHSHLWPSVLLEFAPWVLLPPHTSLNVQIFHDIRLEQSSHVSTSWKITLRTTRSNDI